MELVEKLKDCFDEMLVYKDLKKTNFFSSLSLPAFMRDWLLKKFEDEDGNFDKDELSRFVKKFIPRKDDWNAIKNRIIIEKEKVKFLAKVSINIDIKTGEVSFALPDFGLGFKETIIEPDVWERCKDDLVRGQDIWGMIELGYRAPDDFDFEFDDSSDIVFWCIRCHFRKYFDRRYHCVYPVFHPNCIFIYHDWRFYHHASKISGICKTYCRSA